MSKRIVEAYTGEYAGGKSENALNRALALARQGRIVTLVDLDIVEPVYTLRPIQEELRALGINVIAWKTAETVGLGEAGTTLKPGARWALRHEGDIILDIGYGVEGTRTLNLLEGAATDQDLQVIAVINISRPMTAEVKDIVEHVREMGRVDALLNNTHLADETTPKVVQEGARVVAEAARHLGLPVVATAAVTSIAEEIGDVDCMGNPVRVLTRYMQKAFW
ncbi:hypothetical protein L9W92_11870 [Pelotomaculum terephthalicicum JT]|uniref:hypothetical protein n=1 Tax=Pelotomaculum TaxID=191373 RepID=UPI0009CD1B18|nr:MULTISPECIES: hypothetical protein [Pelotomaculum]MCG9968738.1 hypothetical protein [Pelotomaculum terephthalicicum JT]OPX86632.1 MAG: hypothetical protein A4E54_01985 [Pelotomaculum sp. PtaB.Bin117]